MALYKNSRGDSSRLATQPFHDGYAYLTTNDGKFYIDAIDDDGNEKRILINKEIAKAIIEINANTEINFWIGTTGEYNSLSEEEKTNCLCITTDDLEEVSFESVSNKVTEITEDAKHTTYPSSRAVLEAIEIYGGTDIETTNVIDENSTAEEVPNAAAVYSYIQSVMANINNIIQSQTSTVYSGTSEPDDSIGKVNDIYVITN